MNLTLKQFEAFVWIASTSLHPERVAPAIDELSELAILTHARGTIAFIEIEKHFAARPAGSATLMPSSNMAACLHMAIDGLGVAALPAAMVADESRG